MKKLHRIVWVLPLLLLWVGCDTVEPPEVEPEMSFRIACFMSQEAMQPVFEANGAIEDHGTMAGDPLPWATDPQATAAWSGLRVFAGDKGVVRVHIEATATQEGSLLARGTFTIVGGTGAYASLQGDGEFAASFDNLGQIVEYFTGNLYGD